MDIQLSERALTYAVALILLAVLWALGLVRVLRESERATVRLFGTQLVKGPGLNLCIPMLHQGWRKHAVGDSGVLVGDEQAEFQGAPVAVEVSPEDYRAGPVKIANFVGKGRDTVFLVEPLREDWRSRMQCPPLTESDGS